MPQIVVQLDTFRGLIGEITGNATCNFFWLTTGLQGAVPQ